MIKINLLPPEYRAQPSINPLRLLLLLSIFVVPLGLLGATAYFYFDLQSLERSVEMLRQERAQYGALYDKVLGMERALAEVNAKLAAHQRLVGTHLEPVDILMAFNEVVPENVTVNSLTVQGGGGLSISGVSTDYYGVAAFNLKLDQSEHFARAIMGPTSGGGNKYTFSFSTSYRAGDSAPSGSVPVRSTSGGSAVNPSPAGVAPPLEAPAEEDDQAPAGEAGGGEVY